MGSVRGPFGERLEGGPPIVAVRLGDPLKNILSLAHNQRTNKLKQTQTKFLVELGYEREFAVVALKKKFWGVNSRL